MNIIPELQQLEEAHFAVLQLEEQLKAAKEYLRCLTERDVPEAMEAAGVRTGITPGGFAVTLTDDVHVNMPSVKERGEMIRWCANAPKEKWLKALDPLGLIKRTYSIDFPRGKYREAEDFAARCAAVLRKDFPFTTLEFEETIHGTTLKSFVTKSLRAGLPLPDFFGYYAPRAAKITIPKPVEATDDGIDLTAALVGSLRSGK